ncbi:replication initiation protein [Ligilactobacillus salivarius]|uniref:replication initiation protein n=1 Tax=Ligilactobacillus salivarius TaxID=1624 RepID=UPI001F5128B7|nr:replication initiation protein [Ligilactobacillus salivarius]
MGTIENKKAKNALENLLDRQNYLVTQANELARAFGNLKATEHKILDYCFSYIKKEDTVDTVYHLTLQEILKHLGLNASGRNYTRVAFSLEVFPITRKIKHF